MRHLSRKGIKWLSIKKKALRLKKPFHQWNGILVAYKPECSPGLYHVFSRNTFAVRTELKDIHIKRNRHNNPTYQTIFQFVRRIVSAIAGPVF